MISIKEEGIVTGFLSGNSAAIAVNMSDSEEQHILQNEEQHISQNEGQSIPKNEGQIEGLGELLPERPPERLTERLPERILKLNKTKLNISKESTKKGSEAILEQPKENKLKNAELQEVKLCPVNSFGKKKEGYS